MCAREALADFRGSLVVLSGDTPLLRAETIAGLIAMRESSGAACTVLTAMLANPTGYGRVVRAGHEGAVDRIVEEKDCAGDERRIAEINTGAYCFDSAVLFGHLDRLTTENAQGEYYLTDMVKVFRDEGLTRGRGRRRRLARDDRRQQPRAARRGDQGHAASHQPDAHARRRDDDRPGTRVDRP